MIHAFTAVDPSGDEILIAVGEDRDATFEQAKYRLAIIVQQAAETSDCDEGMFVIQLIHKSTEDRAALGIKDTLDKYFAQIERDNPGATVH